MPKYKTDNIELNYEITGSGEPLLFLHGLGSSIQDWEKQLPYFSGKYKIYLLDLRGHGKSEKPQNEYSLDIFAQDVSSFISDIIKEPVHLVGLSLGAIVACAVASSSSSVKTLTIVNCPAQINLSSVRTRIQYVIRVLIIKLFGTKNIGKLIAPKLFPNPEQENLRQIFIQRWAKNDKQSYLNSMRSLIGWNIFERINQINCPVNVISAEYDYFPIEEKKGYVDKLENAKLILIKNTHHALPFEAPEKFNKALLEVLNKI